MKSFFMLLLCVVVVATAFAADSAYKVTCDGGSLPDMKAGTGLRMSIGAKDVHFMRDKNEVVDVPASAITEISYGQDVHRRVGSAIAIGAVTLGVGALMALTKVQEALCWLDLGKWRPEGGPGHAVRQE